jgi:5-methyltetrahydropteroyltriglutamate--homocysteine methyltransferase
VLTVTRDMILPTTITGSYPRPLWFDRNLDGRSFRAALGDSLFREQYLDAVASIIAEQESAGLDIVTDGDSRFDLTVGGKSWFFYPIERLGGITGHRDTSRGWMSRHGLRPGKILWEVQEAYQPGVVGEKLTRGPLEYAAIWQVAQRMTDRPVKFGAICAPSMAGMLWNAYYKNDQEMMLDLCDIMNAELRDMADAGCPLIQVEEPPHHMRAQQKECTDADLEFLTEAFNRQLNGVNAEIWVHTCWGNPNQQRVHYNVPSYERALPHLLQLNGDVLTIECASSDGKDLPLFKHIKTDKKIAIGVVNHCDTVVEPAEKVAALIRKALEFIPKEKLIISTDCGFGREGLSRRIAFYKCVALVEGTNIVRRELGLPEARVRAADPKLWFAGRESIP